MIVETFRESKQYLAFVKFSRFNFDPAVIGCIDNYVIARAEFCVENFINIWQSVKFIK